MITDVCEQIVDNLELWIQAPPLKFLLYGGYKDPTSEDEKAEFDKAREQFVDEMKRRKKLATAWATKNSSVS
jgi:hypothetical protein